MGSHDMAGDWREAARRELLESRGGAAAWGYRAGASPGVEPTALACLGLLASRRESASEADLTAVRAAAGLLARLQRPDGSLGVSGDPAMPGWATPYALVLWSALEGYEAPRRRAASWLLEQEGLTSTLTPELRRVIGHDPSLRGWSWASDTSSWLEPTAMAVWALRRQGQAGHPRVVEGLRLIRDRAIAAGGWNYGNKAVFGRDLRPQPGPTGLALLSMAGAEGRSAMVERASDYLLAALPGTRASASLGWGLLGLRAWGHRPALADDWLAEAYRKVAGRPDAAPRLAILLLAGGAHAPELFPSESPR